MVSSYPRFFREVLYLSAFAQLGVLTRAYLGRCTASPLSFPGDNFFPDMPANVIGSAIIGLLASSQVLSDSGVRTPIQDVSLAILPSNHPWQLNSVLQLGLRTGYCGSLTTFASWISSMVQSALFLPSSGCHAHWVGSLWGLFIGTTLALSSLLMGQHLALWIRVQLQAEGLTRHKPLAGEIQPNMQVVATEGASSKRIIQAGDNAAVAVSPTQVTPAHDEGAAAHAGAVASSEDVAQDETSTQRVPALASASFLAKLDAAHKSHEEQQQGADVPQSHVAQQHTPQHLLTSSEEELAHLQEAPSQARHLLFLDQLDAAQRSEAQQEQTETVPASHVSQPRLPQHTSTTQQGMSQPTAGEPHTAADAVSVVLHMDFNTDDIAHQPSTRHSQHHHQQAQQEAKLAWLDKIVHSCFCRQPPHQPHSTICDPGGPQLWCGCTVRDTWDVAADVVVLAILLGLTGWTLGSLIAPSAQGLPTPSDSYIWLGILFGPFGCLLRWRLAALNYSLPRPYHWLPLGTLCANLLACMLDFGMAALLAKRGDQLTVVQTSAVTALVLGGGGCLSTVSTWVAEIQKLSSSFPENIHGYTYLFVTITSSVTLGILIYGVVMWVV